MAPDTPKPRPPHPPTPQQPSKRQEMRDAVNQVLQKVVDDRHAASAEQIAERLRIRRRQQRAIVLLAFGVLALIAAVMVMIPRWRQPFPAPTAAEAQRDARAAVLFAARVIDTFRSTRGRLPISLEEAGVALPGISYAMTADGYQLVTLIEGNPLTFTSTDDREAFRRVR